MHIARPPDSGVTETARCPGTPCTKGAARAWNRVTLVYLALGTLAILLGVAFVRGQPTIFLSLGAVTTIMLIASVRARKPSRTWPWVCVISAFVIFMIGGAARSSMNTLGDLTAARSLVPDAITVPGYIALAIGLLGFSRDQGKSDAQKSMLLDGIIAALALVALLWSFLLQPTLHPLQVPILLELVLVSYPALSLCLFVVTLRIAYNRRFRRIPALWLCVGAMTFMLVGDCLFMLAELNLIQVPSQLLDMPYALAFLGAGASGIHPSMRELTDPVQMRHSTTSTARIVVVATALMIMVVITLRQTFSAADRIIMSVLFSALAVTLVLRIVQALRTAARSEERLSFQAHHDELTGLPNRRMLETRLSSTMQRESVASAHIALLFLDIDRFKLVNDALGHRRGDDLLIQVSKRLQSMVRPTDLVARVGGDEFVVLLDHVVALSEAKALAERLRESLLEPFVLGGVEFYVSASVGLAFASDDNPYVTAEALVRDADTAMYQAKDSGRDKVAVFDHSMRHEVSRRLELERDLHTAVAQKQLRLVYQPIVRLPHGPSLGAEALVRWAHPTRGLLLPGEFVPLAEDCGMIADIGNWVMGEALDQLLVWRRSSPHMADAYVSVNLSVAQFRDEAIVERVADLLAFSGLPGSALCLELTESMAMQDPALATKILGEFRRLGVAVALDDFGAEYSSLAYLKQFPVDVLKIDKSFIDSLDDEDTADASLIAAVVAMAKSLGISTIAEGVENSAQARRLQHLGVDAVQGYLFSRPVAQDGVVSAMDSFRERILQVVTNTPG